MRPLSALLSHVLVAFTIECDNLAESSMPHVTTRHATEQHAGAWLVSIVMWWNCMRFVDEHGISLGQLLERARAATNLNGMQRWGYVVVEPPTGSAHAKRPGKDWTIRATRRGLRARTV